MKKFIYILVLKEVIRKKPATQEEKKVRKMPNESNNELELFDVNGIINVESIEKLVEKDKKYREYYSFVKGVLSDYLKQVKMVEPEIELGSDFEKDLGLDSLDYVVLIETFEGKIGEKYDIRTEGYLIDDSRLEIIENPENRRVATLVYILSKIIQEYKE